MDNQPFHVWLLSHVKNSGRSRPEIARSIGCSKPALDKWLSGENTPKVNHLLKLCHLLFDPAVSSMYYLYASNLLGGEHVDQIDQNKNTGPTGSNGPT